MKLPQCIVIVGRIHRQRFTGNSYHTTQIIVDGETVSRTPRQYGGINDYFETACSWLEDNNLIPARSTANTNPWTHIAQDLGISVCAVPIEVSRQKDL